VKTALGATFVENARHPEIDRCGHGSTNPNAPKPSEWNGFIFGHLGNVGCI
jgi:hypothetical protein